jgi:hypothetical protein
MYPKLVKLICLLAFFHPCIAQNKAISAKEVADINKDFLHDFFRPVANRYLSFNYAGPHGAMSYNRNYNKTFVQGYDAKLNEVFNMPVKELAGNKYQGGLEYNNALHIFYADGKKIYRCEIDGNTGNTKSASALVMSVKQDPDHFYKGYSPDSNFCYILFDYDTDRGATSQYEGAVLDKNLNVVTTFLFALKKVDNYIENKTCVLSPEGLFYMIHAVRVKSKEFKPLQYLLTEISKDGKEVTNFLEDLPQGRFNNVIWKPVKNGLSFTGLLAKNEKEGFKYILTGQFNSWQKKLTDLKEQDFTASPYWQSATDKFLKEIQTGGVNSEVNILNSFTNDDGSMAMVMQRKVITTTFRGNYSYTDTHTGSVYAMKMNADGSLAWLQVIPCSQSESTYPIYSGAIAMQRKNKDVVVVLLDNEKNLKRKPEENFSGVGVSGSCGSCQLTAVIIKDDGTITRSGLGKGMAPDHFMAPNKPFVVYDDEILYTSFHDRNLGRSTYKLGVIRL